MSSMSEIHAGEELAQQVRGETMWQPAWKVQSDEIGELAQALAKAQAKMTGAVKNSKNPFFDSSYADLASVIEGSRAALSENGLAVIQTTTPSQAGTVRVVTTLAHSSGQWLRSYLDVPLVKSGPQAMGSSIAYGRRYSHAAIVGLAQVDDDGEAAMARKPKAVKATVPTALKDTAREVAETGLNGLQDWFKALPISDREALTSDPKWWEGLKRVASGNSNASAA